MRHARLLFGLCAATRMTAAKSGDDIFSAASFTIAGSSAKNESPASSVTARMMLSGHAVAHRGKEHLEERRLLIAEFRHRTDQSRQGIGIEALEGAQRPHELFRQSEFDDRRPFPPLVVPEGFEITSRAR